MNIKTKMKNLIYLSILLLPVVFSSSCKTIRWNVRDTATLDVVKSGVFTKPKVADLKIDASRVIGSASGNVKEETFESIKSKALQDALKKSSADILVEPIYEVERDDKTLVARVSGFPAKVTSFKDIVADDTLAFSMASKFYVQSARLNTNDASIIAQQENLKREARKRKIKKIVLGVSLGVAIPIILGLGLGFGLGI